MHPSVHPPQERRSPDRATAVASAEELRRACPARRWNLVCVDVSLAEAGFKKGGAVLFVQDLES